MLLIWSSVKIKNNNYVASISVSVKIDFTNCIPINEVVVVPIITQPADPATGARTMQVITPDSYSQTLRNDGDSIFKNPFVSFVFSSASLPVYAGLIGTVNF
jgi:hypothetical protein